MSVRASLPFLIAAAVLLAGCVSEDKVEKKEGPVVAAAPEEAEVTHEMGAIKGSLTSDLFEPLSGGTVTVVETAQSTRVAKNGFFTINDVPPGTYVVHFSKEGYADLERNVVVNAGEVTEVVVQLVPAVGVHPFSELIEISGQATYDVRYQVETTGKCERVENDVIPVTTCGGSSINLVYGIHLVNVTDDMQTVLFEAIWKSAGPIGENLFMYTLCPKYSNDRDKDYFGDPCYIRAEGTKAPLIIRLDRDALEGTIPYTGDWYTRISGGYGVLGTYDLVGADVGAAYEQKFTLFFSYFHHEKAPDGYTALPES